MKFSVDDTFRIGGAHLRAGMPCQDYTTSAMIGSVAEPEPLIVVCDGCSSGRHTDVGARLLALGTVPIASVYFPNTSMIEECLTNTISDTRRNLALRQDDLFATHLYAGINKSGFLIRVRGDGVVAVQYADGSYSYHHYSWANNMPAYPAYIEDKYADFIAAQGGLYSEAHREHVIAKFIGGADPCELDEVHIHTVAEAVRGRTIHFPHVSNDPVKTIALFTDGVDQVEGYTWREVVDELLAFKSYKGDFVKRRMAAFLRDAAARGRGPQDDIGYAVINVEE